MLVLALSDVTAQKKIILFAKNANPDIIIISRVQFGDSESKDLPQLGVQTIVIPEFEAGIVLGREVLTIFDRRAARISGYIKRLKEKQLVSQ